MIRDAVALTAVFVAWLVSTLGWLRWRKHVTARLDELASLLRNEQQQGEPPANGP